MSLEQEMIDRYVQAERDLLDGKTITFNGRTLSSENLSEIRAGRHEWERRLNSKKSGQRHSLGRICW